MADPRTLTVKQRKFVRTYLETGNGTQAALVAYDTEDERTAHAIASENLRKPAVQLAVSALLEAEGISDRKLREIHAYYLALYASDDPREKALGLKALDMAYKVTGAYKSEERPRDIFDDWRIEELQTFVATGAWPTRLRPDASGRG